MELHAPTHRLLFLCKQTFIENEIKPRINTRIIIIQESETDSNRYVCSLQTAMENIPDCADIKICTIEHHVV